MIKYVLKCLESRHSTKDCSYYLWKIKSSGINYPKIDGANSTNKVERECHILGITFLWTLNFYFKTGLDLGGSFRLSYETLLTK